jgi:hypothetical protein
MDILVEDLPENTSQTIQSPQAAARSDAVAHLALAPRFNIDTPTKQEEGKLAEIWALAQGVAKSADIQDVLWEVIHLEGVLGAPRLGESRLDRLYKYAKLKRQEAQIQRGLQDVALTGRV